ncbi:hypothetical protein [Sinorhizobium meliloti]|nr:hypothetical protein [Sinorhizobium meliloti]
MADKEKVKKLIWDCQKDITAYLAAGEQHFRPRVASDAHRAPRR